jgi:phage tail tape-measure protein
MWDWAEPNKNGANQFFTRDLPSGLIHQGLPAVGATLGGIAGAELGPVGSMAGAYAGRKAGEATADKMGELYGYGLYSDLKKAGKAALKKQIAHYAPAVGRNLAKAGADYIGIPSGVAGVAGHYAGQYAANRLNEAIGEGV